MGSKATTRLKGTGRDECRFLRDAFEDNGIAVPLFFPWTSPWYLRCKSTARSIGCECQSSDSRFESRFRSTSQESPPPIVRPKIELRPEMIVSMMCGSRMPMPEMGIQVLTICMAVSVVSRIDTIKINPERALLDTKWYVTCISGTQNSKLTVQRSRGTVHASRVAILWSTLLRAVMIGRARRRCVCQNHGSERCTGSAAPSSGCTTKITNTSAPSPSMTAIRKMSPCTGS